MWGISQPAKELLSSQEETLLYEFKYIITKNPTKLMAVGKSS
jgi:hypothetical protein